MAWATPLNSKSAVDAAGATLVDDSLTEILSGDPSFGNRQTLEAWDKYDHALQVVNNWRSSHNFPLNTFQCTLRRKARQVDPRSLIAQRIKRISSIELKLRRFPSMKLAQMQDIGGCRAVVRSIRHVDGLVQRYEQSDLKHALDHKDDYIRHPRSSGYRGVHLIYRYNSDKKETWNGLKLEMQFRSPLQHAWATAVETVGTFIQQALKSSQGEEEWLRFFALMGGALALRERTAPVPGTPTQKTALVRELRQYARSLDVERRLRTYGEAIQTTEQPGVQNAHYYILALDPGAQRVTVRGYPYKELERASNEYLVVEKEIKSIPGAEAVLVSVESLASLRRAYPNYFLDTRVFIDAVKRAIG